jgi:hypothetical protein
MEAALTNFNRVLPELNHLRIFRPRLNDDRGLWALAKLEPQLEPQSFGLIKKKIGGRYGMLDLLDVFVEADRLVDFSDFSRIRAHGRCAPARRYVHYWGDRTKRKKIVRLGLPRISRLKENAPEFHHSSFYVTTGTGNTGCLVAQDLALLTRVRLSSTRRFRSLPCFIFRFVRAPLHQSLGVKQVSKAEGAKTGIGGRF